MKVKRQELLDALVAVRPAVGKDVVIDGANNVFIMGEEVLAYDDEVCISKFIDCEDPNLECAIPEKPLIALLKKLKTETISIKQEQGEIIIGAKRSTAGINIQGIPSHLANLSIPDDEWTQLPLEFHEALTMCLMSVGSDMSVPVLCNVHFKGKWVESIDNIRATRFTFENELFGDFLLPTEAAKRLVNIRPTHFSFDGNDPWVHFYNEETGIVLSARRGSGDFFDLTPIMEVSGDTYHFPTSTREAMDRAAIMAKSEDNVDDAVKFVMKDGELHLSTEGTHGWFEEKIAVPDYEHTDIGFILNPNFFNSELLLTHGITIHTNEEGSGVLAIKGKQFVHVVRLVSAD